MNSVPSPPLEDRIEELMFLAEAITEQTNRLENLQTKYSRQLRRAVRRRSTLDSSSKPTQEFQELLSRLDTYRELQAELCQRQVDLTKKEEKIRGQAKSLTLRFKAERTKLLLEKKELELQKKQLEALQDSSEPVALQNETGEAGTSDGTANSNAATLKVDAESDGNISSIAEIEVRLAELQSLLSDSEAENHELFSENQSLRNQLYTVAQSGDVDQQSTHIAELFDVRRQLELTLEQLQEARSEIVRLESNATQDRAGETTWEEQKRRLLASLEGDTEPTVENPRELIQRLKESEELLSEKERTIAQLEALLQGYEENDREALAEEEQQERKLVLDNDEMIQAERKRLAELEQHWRDKIGKAEIELSQERARLSRDQRALETRLAEFEKKTGESEESTDQPKEPRKRKWMERMGLG